MFFKQENHTQCRSRLDGKYNTTGIIEDIMNVQKTGRVFSTAGTWLDVRDNLPHNLTTHSKNQRSKHNTLEKNKWLFNDYLVYI